MMSDLQRTFTGVHSKLTGILKLLLLLLVATLVVGCELEPKNPIDDPDVTTGNGEGLTGTAAETLAQARQLIVTNQQQAAWELLTKLIEAEPQNADAYMLRGIAYMRQGKTLPAIKDMNASVQIDPTGERYYNFGNVLHQAGYFQRAARAFRLALELTPDDPEILNNLGSALMLGRNEAEAIPVLERASQLRPGDPEPLTNLGIAHQRMEDYGTAESYYQRALDVDPEYYQAVFNLAKLYERTGQDDEASEAYYRYLDLRPNAPDFSKIENRAGGPRDNM